MDTRHERTTPRAPSEMVASWMPGRRFLGRVGSGNLVRSVSLDYGDLLREDLAVVRRQWLIDHPSSSGRSNWRSGGQGGDLDAPGCRFSERVGGVRQRLGGPRR